MLCLPISDYFDFKYRIDDFVLSGMTLSTDINVQSHEKVSAYLKVLKRISRVKGFSPVSCECFGESRSFCLEGNSNGIAFLLYDLGEMCRKQLGKADGDRKKLKEMIEKSEETIRAEVRLTKLKAIRMYTDASNVFGQMKELSEKRQDIFLDIFTRVVPFGNFYKKDKAEEIIRSEIKDSTLRRKMLRLVALIPEKKSLHLAQKAMNCRNIEKVMDAFTKINLSPVTISKRQNIKHLKNIYEYLFEVN